MACDPLSLPVRPVKDDSGQHEVLACDVNARMDDDTSLAIQFSLLRDPELVGVMEKKWGLYIALWPLMMLVAVMVAVKVALWRVIKRPTDRERLLLGPEQATWCFDRAHPYGRLTRNGVATSAALDVIYSVGVALRHPRTVGEWLVRFWLDQPDGQAVRNRLRLTYRALGQKFESLWQAGRGRDSATTIRVLSLACGSAQAMVEAVAAFRQKHPQAKVVVSLIDLSDQSLARAARLACEYGVEGCFEVVPANLKGYLAEAIVSGRTWDLVEMVGFLDYRSEKSLVNICRQVRQVLADGGLAVLAHINPSPWGFVVRWVINWPLLVRRSPKQFGHLLHRAGWGDKEVQLVTEPNRIHTVALCGAVDDE